MTLMLGTFLQMTVTCYVPTIDVSYLLQLDVIQLTGLVGGEEEISWMTISKICLQQQEMVSKQPSKHEC